MSDDEEYYEEYEIIWIDEPEPGLADDLAETAHHDPVLVDDPSYEVEEYFSDWDDLSDDYYDDEPTIIRRQRMAALKNGTSAAVPNPPNPHSGDQLNTQSKPGLFIDPASFQSVVWKPSNYDREPTKLHPPGEGEKVALLKNWREVFKNSNPALDRPARFKKLASSSPNQSGAALATRSGIVDDLRREDSSDRTSGISSLENLRDNEAVDSGDASNTTPAKSTSPASVKVSGSKPDEEMAGVGADETGKTSSNVVVEIPVPKVMSSPPKKRGRKRKADVVAEGGTENGDDANGTENNNKRPRSKRVASNATGPNDKTSNPTQGPLRRSTRQKG